ncbi:MAG TPA: cbb3-type cytochrome c oxidase N-terminal domain-containing protein [Blastocatellia bacterium]|nr:cbb3-type cytochrome c oxidase N-terminal domain-containing protein [Blastocatellia bacterium]
MSDKEKDKLLEHDADGIREFDNDLPLWWLFGFIFTVAFSAVYLINYHLADGPSSKAEYEAEVAAYKKTTEPQGAPAQAQIAELKPLTDDKSLMAGKAIFDGSANMCYTCHRNDLGGMVGPNLTDEFWIHGGDFKSIVKSIKVGFPDKGMMPYGSGAKLTDEQVVQLASYIKSKHGSNPPNAKPIDPQRELKFEEAEHREDAKHDEGKEKKAKPGGKHSEETARNVAKL